MTRHADPISHTSPPRLAALCTWLVAFVVVLQSVLAPMSLAAPATDRSSESCGEGGTCCCGDPDICLCVAECPASPMAPTRDDALPSRIEPRAFLAILPSSNAISHAMAFSPRTCGVAREVARPVLNVRVQALLSVWLT